MVVRPLSQFRSQGAMAPLNRRFLQHPAGENRSPQIIPNQVLQLGLFIIWIKPPHQHHRLQRSSRGFKVDSDGTAGVADQQNSAAMAKADPTPAVCQLGWLARRTMEGYIVTRAAKNRCQLLPEQRSALKVATSLQLRQSRAPTSFPAG